jgi:hypothetical protein
MKRPPVATIMVTTIETILVGKEVFVKFSTIAEGKNIGAR